ncbi:hypothetical protein EJ04DRAFT_444934 [Polyplosphaeria fusca]|uniref:RBR-type E3 ubiquitin transferase n=1 Tax=Polyplosphaeria fusca TaxID=682080 RepID=A0A9P4UYX4_9PLEO|nr:hypothetical protein EJ04DRAFT_444934 [Polyplosphaeria fusca]
MATTTATEVYDLLILVDATCSMSNYLEALKSSLPRVIAISKLTNSFARIGLLAYRDYTEAHRDVEGLLEWSGWYEHGQDSTSANTLMTMASNLEPIGGGDYPEATKTGLARACSLMREEATTIVLLYTDAPPHCWMVAEKDRGSNYHAEQKSLNDKNSYGGYGPHFADWVAASKYLHKGPRKAHVFCFLDQGLERSPLEAGYYLYLSMETRGACFYMTDARPSSIAHVTVEVLLAWMGAQKQGAGNTSLPAKLVRYRRGDDIKKIKSEKDPVANIYFWAHHLAHEHPAMPTMEENLAKVDVDSEVLKRYLPKKKTLVTDFSRQYASDERYRKIVVDELNAIIENDVTSMSLNSVFGSLWRTVCNDRENPARDDLISKFSLHVDKIADVDEKSRMKNWLEESYDYAADIRDLLTTVPEDQLFPCVYLDPTIEFRPANQRGVPDEDEDEQDRPITAFRRDELLEIGRSCDGRILRRLGKVLTRLTFVESAANLPSHISDTTNGEVPKIPIALASKEHGCKFWKILLHIVLPGTMLSARSAVLLAALAIRIGLKPLFEPASAAMLSWRDRWNNLEVPETWNSSCLGLLLDADAEYRKQSHVEQGVLLDSDRRLFSSLVAYKLAEANLLTTLTAQVGWTPSKTQMPVGPVVTCRGCNYPRSITIMAEKTRGKCGLCVVTNWTDAAHKTRAQNAHVTKDANETSRTTWIECSVRTCRAQYVCYNPEDMNVRPKCHYCRLQGAIPPEKRSVDPAPTLECAKCLNKIIWPQEWRYLAPSPFACTACINNMKTVVAEETNASQICKENGQAWLLRNNNNTLKEPFKGSVFKTISTVGPAAFLANVSILPTLDYELHLTLRGKLIRNQPALKADLESWIQRRTSEKASCSLCFSDFPHARLLPACRRRGCHQRICEACLNGWYGLNRPGSIINTAALFCPFCRRPPAARTLAAYGMGIHAVGNLKVAVEERGQWIHAWCRGCSKASRYMERSCAQGAPDSIHQFKCDHCNLSAVERAQFAEEEARRAVEVAARLGEAERIAAVQRLRQAKQRRRGLETPVKNCPGCKTPTQKTYGCDHMECNIRQCHTHWCWACGEKFDEREIYNHMRVTHGGLYTGGGGEDSDDEDW